MADDNELRILRQDFETLREMFNRLLITVEALTAYTEAVEAPYEPRIVGGPEVA